MTTTMTVTQRKPVVTQRKPMREPTTVTMVTRKKPMKKPMGTERGDDDDDDGDETGDGDCDCDCSNDDALTRRRLCVALLWRQRFVICASSTLLAKRSWLPLPRQSCGDGEAVAAVKESTTSTVSLTLLYRFDRYGGHACRDETQREECPQLRRTEHHREWSSLLTLSSLPSPSS